MDIRKLQRIVVDALDDIKAQDIKVYNTTELTSLFDRVIIASGSSNRQTRALAAHVRDKVKSEGGQVISVEGEDGGEWVLVDLGDAVVHIMQPAIRAYYRLEELWGAKPVSVKAGGPAGKRARTAESSAEHDADSAAEEASVQAPARRAAASKSPAANKPAAKKPAAKKPAAKKPASSTQASSTQASGKPASGKPASGKPASGKPASGKPASPRSGTAKKPAPKTASARAPRKARVSEA
jgi:ribosome-associated protein